LCRYGVGERAESVYPGPAQCILPLEIVDPRLVLERLRDGVEALEQGFAPTRGDLEADLPATGSRHDTMLQVHPHARSGGGSCVLGKGFYVGARQAYGKQAVLEAVVEEDVAEAGRDHAAHTHGQQCPDRAFARAAAAEVGAREQDLRMAAGRLV